MTTQQALALIECAETAVQPQFARLEQIALHNQEKVLAAFQANNVGLRHFAPTTGYGYDDIGRDTLDAVFAAALGAQDALVRPSFASGTHALYTMLSGLLLPGDELLCASGKPYDTLEQAIGISGSSSASLRAFGITYRQTELTSDGAIDLPAVLDGINAQTKVVYVQRSRGYEWRRALDLAQIGALADAVHAKNPTLIVAVDNCYGEFTQTQEPTQVGSDVMAGSLIKNPGGGIAPGGGYVAGRADLLARVAERMTSAGIGREVGSYAAPYTPFYQGLFLAPHVTLQCLKGASLFAQAFAQLGFAVCPPPEQPRDDIIQAIRFDDEKKLISFCQSVQRASPVDAHALPLPWDMPGYAHQVIMAAGAFIQGASIELSADAPIKPPYIAYVQGGLTYEHAKIALKTILQAFA